MSAKQKIEKKVREFKARGIRIVDGTFSLTEQEGVYVPFEGETCPLGCVLTGHHSDKKNFHEKAAEILGVSSDYTLAFTDGFDQAVCYNSLEKMAKAMPRFMKNSGFRVGAEIYFKLNNGEL